MSLAVLLERVERKLDRYRGRIDEAREEGLFTRDYTKIEECVRRIWRLQRRARSAMKKLPATERRQEIAAAYGSVHQLGEESVKHLLELRAELLHANVSASLRVRAAEAAGPAPLDARGDRR